MTSTLIHKGYVQEFMLIPLSAASFSEALRMGAETNHYFDVGRIVFVLRVPVLRVVFFLNLHAIFTFIYILIYLYVYYIIVHILIFRNFIFISYRPRVFG